MTVEPIEGGGEGGDGGGGEEKNVTTRQKREVEIYEEGEEPICPWMYMQSVAHPRNCSKYVKCVGKWLSSGPFVEECPAGTLFNPDIKRCDDEKNVNCTTTGESTVPQHFEESEAIGGGGGGGGGKGGGGGGKGGGEGGGGEKEQKWNFAPVDYEESEMTLCLGSSAGLRAHPRNCSQFVSCFMGTASVVQECRAGTLFNPVTTRCDDEKNVNCTT
ncbi:hypothetical protein LSTR_LSTR006561 [Laodelphax striatellus]|uniref:Chitin-binding type-2 domain-containing protein n=1 Tax=Laodelphax striatellus TaxID=195883 RepID=A0A482WUE9_LAOST|nr:hypothetical protein LSTR_LSTR006561 [Laodelphax striatellus]